MDAMTLDQLRARTDKRLGFVRMPHTAREDCVQDALLKLWPLVESGKIRKEAALDTWIRRTGYDRAKYEARRNHVYIRSQVKATKTGHDVREADYLQGNEHMFPDDRTAKTASQHLDMWSLLLYSTRLDPVAGLVMALVDYGDKFKEAEASVLGIWKDPMRTKTRIAAVITAWRAS